MAEARAQGQKLRDTGGAASIDPQTLQIHHEPPVPAGTYTMKQTCELTGLSYETLKYYCKEGLVPNVARDRANRRVFNERNIGWIRDLICLRNCGMGIDEMHAYLDLCLRGRESVPERQRMLAEHRAELEARIAELEGFLSYIQKKEALYRGFLDGTIPYMSNLVDRG